MLRLLSWREGFFEAGENHVHDGRTWRTDGTGAAIVTAHPTSIAVPGPRALEARLFAPCCWNGTLDMHESELARELRKEIESRFEQGETSYAIQEDFVHRFGDRVLASQSEKPMLMMGLMMTLLLGCSALVLAAIVRRWVRANPPGGGVSEAVAARECDLSEDAGLEARLDEELTRLG